MARTGRQIIVTGVSRGLGLALTRRFVEDGHRVSGCARSAKAIESLRRSHGAAHSFHVVDVSDEQAVAGWASELISPEFCPDLIVNNAALINRNASLWDVPADEFSRLIDVNIKGVANVLRHFLPAMISRGRGVVVNFSSGWGRSTAPEVAPYCASKWAIEGMTQALAAELPRGMAAVALNPGIIDTAMLRSCFGSSAASYPPPETWAKRAVPYVLGLGPRENGQALTVPG